MVLIYNMHLHYASKAVDHIVNNDCSTAPEHHHLRLSRVIKYVVHLTF